MKKPVTLLDLINPPQPFYLTGSRFFSTMRLSSDYDYFTEYNEEIVSWLKEKGFKPYAESAYDDTNTIAIYCFAGDAQIDVQLVRNVVAKMHVQECLLQSGLLEKPFMNKSDARRLWDFGFAILGIKQ